MTNFDFLVMLGVVVVEVPGMAAPGCYVTTQNVALLRAGLSDEDREDTSLQLCLKYFEHAFAA